MEQQKLLQVQQEVNQVIQGKEDVVKKVFAAMIAGGHILMEDIPGVGKTTLATTFAKTLELVYHRVQFTPDVLPSVEGKTWKLPEPFFVIATQNPSGSSGTQLLPESQLDRFMICLSMGYPSHRDAVSILKGEVWKQTDKRQRVLSIEELKELQREAEQIYVHDEIYEYIVSLVEETRKTEFFAEGASPRATIALLRMARAIARLEGRDFVTAQDVQCVLKDVLGHRVKLGARARAEGKSMEECIQELILQVKSPRS